MYTIPKNLLSKGSSNAKTAKNAQTTYILYLAPYTQNSKKINIYMVFNWKFYINKYPNLKKSVIYFTFL